MKKVGFLMLLALLQSQLLAAQSLRKNTAYQAYIEGYKDIAIREMLTYGIPASITLAQGVLESGAGQSELALKGNNHFGIKCNGWQGRTIYHDDDATGECFRAYDDALGSFEDHSKFLAGRERYRRLFQLKRTDYKGWARGLKACGYATSPTYAQRLIEIIELYRLYEYDSATSYDEAAVRRAGRQQFPSPSGLQPSVVGGQVAPQAQLTNAVAHQIFPNNKNLYLVARRGDSFRSIAAEVGIGYKKLAKYNERGKNDVLSEGDIIYLKKKQTRADKSYKNRPHVIKPGDSMYAIAQRYGIQLKSLYSKNGLSPDYQIRVGSQLRIY